MLFETQTDLIRILQASLAPVTVISGAGLLLSSMTARYGRTSDRIRVLLREFGLRTDETDILRRAARDELVLLYRRARMIRTEIVMVASSIFCVALTIFFLFGSLLYHAPLGARAAQACFLASLVLLLVAMVFFIADILASLRALKVNITAYMPLGDIHPRRTLRKDEVSRGN